jgi:hypothetical protein
MRRCVSWRDWERSELTSDTKRGCRFSLLTFLCVLTLFCALLAYLRWYLIRDYWVVTTVDFANGEELVVLVEAYSDMGISYYYEVWSAEREIVPTRYIATVYPPGELHYDVVKSEDGKVVGVHWKEANDYICLHDSSSGKTWPYDPLGGAGDDDARLSAIKEELIRKLEAGDGK